MCLIIHNPLCLDVDPDIIESALWQNQDGFGIFYHDTGEILRTMSADKVFDILTDIKRGYTCHFRYSTSGKIGKKQCHPFRIDDRYSLMMNGTIERLVSSKTVDTMELCKILAGLEEERILNILRTYSCRFSLLNHSTGQAIMVNRDLWTEHKGVHFSKDPVAYYTRKTPTTPLCPPSTTSPWKYQSTVKPYGYRKSDAWMAPEVGGRNALDDPWDDDPFDTTSKEWQAYYDSLEQLELEDSLATLPSGELHLVAVYGTLKQGRGNHDRHLSKAAYIGDGVTDELYPMVVGGIPYLIDEPGKGHRVKVEVYQVDNATLRKLDGLEGHPGWYVRRKLKIRLTAGGSLEAWVYTIPLHRRYTHMDDTGVYHNEF